MAAVLVYHERKYFVDGSFKEIKIWRVLKTKDRPHGLRYSFAYIVNNKRVVGYDNYEHKGDHRHYKGKEYPYEFKGLTQLWRDFVNDIKKFREENYEG